MNQQLFTNGAIFAAAFYAVRPLIMALAILMLDWGKRGPARLKAFQSLNGKAPMADLVRRLSKKDEGV